jgi:hypothetical protein
MNDRSIHLSLLDQVANSEHERDEARRILGELADKTMLNDPSVELFSDAEIRSAVVDMANRAIDRKLNYAAHTQSLCDRCEEGMSACITPEACRLAEPDARPQRFARYGLLLSVAIVAGIAWAVFG